MEPNVEEAERRIAAARETGAESLDLGDLRLCRLPISLGDLPHLKALYLGAIRLTEMGDREWDSDRENLELSDLEPLAKLQGLKRLDLSRTGLTDLTPLAKLKGLQNLNLWNSGITDVSPISDLHELRSLDLSSTGVTDLAPLAELRSLQTLYLSGSLVKDLSPLGGLQGLRSLYFLSGAQVSILTPLSKLYHLQQLYLSQCDALTDLTPLAELKSLETLCLSACKSLTDLTPVAECSALTDLNISQSTGLKNLTPLARLWRLRKLNLANTSIAELSSINGLTKLLILNLSCTNVIDLSPLENLKNLRSLNLSHTNVTTLNPLARLQNLQILSLSNTGVTNLAPISRLEGLQTLGLSNTGVADLSPLAGLQELENLGLSRTCVKDLNPLEKLQKLQKLDFRHSNCMTGWFSLAKLQGLQTLDLYGCRPAVPLALLRVLAEPSRMKKLIVDEAIGVPWEVLSHEGDNNCLSRLRTHLFELTLGPESENEVKVILLGNGHVGKTQLCRRFRGEPFDSSVASTHGVQIWREELNFQTAGLETAFQVNWWDFGGQDIYHGTHALFLRNRAVFLVLWNPASDDRKEFSENGLVLRNQPLAYWLDYVRSLAGKDSPVIVVQSQCDTFADRRPASSKPDGFDFFESCSFSAQTDLGRETLEGQLRDAMRYLLERNGALEIGHGRAEVRRRLYAWRREDQQRTPVQREHRTLSLDEFRALCEEVGGIVSSEHALDYLHHTGVVFYQPDLFADCIILDQDWALEAVYTVFHRGKAVPWLRDSGRFTREDLAVAVWQDHSLEEQKLFLGLMESCGVCFRSGETTEGEARYVAPDLLPKFEAVEGRLYAWKADTSTPTLRLEYRFFHQAIIRDLMNRIGSKAGDLAEYWKYGLWFKDGRRDTQFLLQFEDISTNEVPGAGSLVLKAQGHDPLGLLYEIRKAILRQRIGEEPEELLTLDGVTVARSALATAIAGQVLDRQKTPVSAAAFTAFFEGRELALETRESTRPNHIDIAPQRLTENEKLPEVFISYAWGDPTSAGRDRTKAVDGLCSALERDGFLPIRDRDQIYNGELISAFIRRLTRADHAVAIISDKYLRSPYCMFEIYKLWQKSETEAEEMAQRVIPIVLPKVKIGSVVERAPYVRYWMDYAKTLGELIRELGTNASSKSQQEARLVREFAHHIDDILVFLNDVLMPRQLEVHLDNDFKAVRDALRRRLGKSETLP